MVLNLGGKVLQGPLHPAPVPLAPALLGGGRHRIEGGILGIPAGFGLPRQPCELPIHTAALQAGLAPPVHGLTRIRPTPPSQGASGSGCGSVISNGCRAAGHPLHSFVNPGLP